MLNQSSIHGLGDVTMEKSMHNCNPHGSTEDGSHTVWYWNLVSSTINRSPFWADENHGVEDVAGDSSGACAALRNGKHGRYIFLHGDRQTRKADTRGGQVGSSCNESTEGIKLDRKNQKETSSLLTFYGIMNTKDLQKQSQKSGNSYQISNVLSSSKEPAECRPSSAPNTNRFRARMWFAMTPSQGTMMKMHSQFMIMRWWPCDHAWTCDDNAMIMRDYDDYAFITICSPCVLNLVGTDHVICSNHNLTPSGHGTSMH